MNASAADPMDPGVRHVARENHEAARAARRRWDELKTERNSHERDWQSIARLLRPQRSGFGLDDHTGEHPEKPLSSAPIMAQTNFAAGLYGSLTNPANRWMGLRTADPDLNRWQPARAWLDTASDIVLGSFAPAVSPFYSAAVQLFSDLAAFGNAAQYDEAHIEERRILDQTLSLAEVVWDIDGHGRVCEVVRRFRLKPAAAVALFRGAVPARVAEMAERGANDRVVFLQHVLKNDGYRRGMAGARGKPWLSLHVCEIGDTLVREGGYEEMPFYVARWEVESGATCGTGPGFVALASARTHARMDEATIRAAQRAADPTILAPDRQDWPLSATIRPGAVVYGGINMQGQRMLAPLDTFTGINLTLQEKQAKLDEIRDAFHFTLMNLAGRTGMTATEVMTINEERMRLWAPHMGRVQEEYLAPKIARRFGMLWRAGQIPPPPPEMAGAPLQVDYLSAAAMAQRSTEGASIVRLIEDIGPLAQAKPRLLDRIDEDALIEALAEARGAPARILRDRETADAIAQARQQAEQLAQGLAAARQGAGAMKDMGAAMAAMQGMGGGMAGGGAA
jgi:hypothetical protein